MVQRIVSTDIWSICTNIIYGVSNIYCLYYEHDPEHVASGWTVQHHKYCQSNWAILPCDVITDGKTYKLRSPQNRPFQSLFTENCTVHSGKPADTTMASSRGNHLQNPFLAIHSADEHRMIYSFSNTTSYSTFYAFFSSFPITLWPTWLANSKLQPCFYPP